MALPWPDTLPPATRGDFLAEIADLSRLRDACAHVRSVRLRGAAGIDGVTVDRFVSCAESALVELRRRIAAGRYLPPPLRRTLIPKPDGSYRVVGIPTVADSIVQHAAALALHGRIAMTFSDASYAYRPHLGPKRAAARLAEMVNPGAWVVIADVEKFFDNVDHACLLTLLEEAGIDAGGRALVERWLRAPVVLDRHLKTGHPSTGQNRP